MDTPEALSRLESLGPSVAVESPTPAEALMTHREGVRRWLASLDVRPGLTLSPSAGQLARIFTAHADAQGWRLDAPTVTDMGRLLKAAGLESSRRAGYGYLVNRDAAAELWRAAGMKRPTRSGSRKRRPKPPRVTRHPSKPLRACDGRMWRSQRDAMATLGVTALAVSRAVHQGGTVGGVHVRFATPAEVRAWRALEEEWDGGIGSPS